MSSAYEWHFVGHGLNEVDEGWPLYAAMRLAEGGVLYRDVFFVFPPGHLLPAWLAWTLDPPGVVLARCFYAAFNVALVAALYRLGQRLMPAPFALLGAGLVALAAPTSHLQHLLFGYRYLLFGALALLALERRLRSDDARWMLASGFATGTALCFRLTPAFAAAAGVAAAILVTQRPGRAWLREAGAFAIGLLVAALPVVIWLASQVGVETLWREVVVRPVAMTALQTKPLPPLGLPPRWDRALVSSTFVALLFRLGLLLYAGYALVLAGRWLRSRLRREPFADALLLALVVFGGVYFTRVMGRSDEPHLSSAIPPACLVLAHFLSLPFRNRGRAGAETRGGPRLATALVCALALTAWIVLWGADRVLDPAWRGAQPVRTLGGAVATRDGHWWVDPRVERIRQLTRPGDRILVLGPAALFYVLADRPGPGWADVLMPGTFLDAREEEAFLRRLQTRPPALVVRAEWPFDLMPERAVERTAPGVAAWVEANYRFDGDRRRYGILIPGGDGNRRHATPDSAPSRPAE